MSISFFASIKSITVPIKEVWDSKRLGFALGCWNDRFLGKLSWYSKKKGGGYRRLLVNQKDDRIANCLDRRVFGILRLWIKESWLFWKFNIWKICWENNRNIVRLGYKILVMGEHKFSILRISIRREEGWIYSRRLDSSRLDSSRFDI